MTSLLNDVVEKVKKLLNLAENSDKPGEVAAAQFIAQELMTKYQIEEAQLNGHTGQGDVISAKVDNPPPYSNDKAILLHYIAKHNFCKVLQGDKFCMLYGYESDVKLCLAAYNALSLHMIVEMRSKLKQYKKNTKEKVYVKGWIKSFFNGYCITISERFKEAKAKVINDYESNGVSVALVVRDKQHIVEEFFQNLSKGKVRKKKISTGSGYEAGVTSAKSANIGQTSIEG